MFRLLTCVTSVKLGFANLRSAIPAPMAIANPIAAYAPAIAQPTVEASMITAISLTSGLATRNEIA